VAKTDPTNKKTQVPPINVTVVIPEGKAKWTDVAVVVLTGGIVLLAVMQWLAMRAANQETEFALHVSERAYMSIGTPTLDVSKGVVTLQLFNTGHIPSGVVNVWVHEATLAPPPPYGGPHDFKAAVERHWKHHTLPSAPPGNPFGFVVPLPGYSDHKVDTGESTVVISGSVTYNDGFPKDDDQEWPFCMETVYHLVLKQTLWAPCDASVVLKQMEADDGYPNGEDKT
jgi:hypothetical protein